MRTRCRTRLTAAGIIVAGALAGGGAPALAAATPVVSASHASTKAAAHRRALARRASARRAAARRAATATREIPVSFTVRNTNTSNVPCTADGATYVVRGHLVGPAGRLKSGTAQAGALYVHGLGYGEFFWDFKGVPGYDYAAEQAASSGLVSVVIDRLGYGASGRPDGNAVCYGSEADYLHQIVGQLRAGSYTSGDSTARPSFRRVALVGHSAGGFMVEVEAKSYGDVDALVLAGFSDTGSSPLTLATFTRTGLDCYTAPEPHNYAYFGKTAADFRAAHFANADPRVADAVTAIRAPDPCMDTGSAPQSIAVDLANASAVKVPVLIVNGADDALFPPPAGDEAKAFFLGNPDLTQVTLPATGHAVTLGRTAPQFRSLMSGWLKQRGF